MEVIAIRGIADLSSVEGGVVGGAVRGTFSDGSCSGEVTSPKQPAMTVKKNAVMATIIVILCIAS
jgi:hypothetical protein